MALVFWSGFVSGVAALVLCVIAALAFIEASDNGRDDSAGDGLQ